MLCEMMIAASERRCPWAKTELSIAYHDHEWGVPLHGDDALFGLLVLEGAQARLSWETILRKRARYYEVFDAFSVARVAQYNENKVASLLADAGIVRNRAKINAAARVRFPGCLSLELR